MDSKGDAGGYGQVSLTHLWRQANEGILAKHGQERVEHLSRVQSATQDLLRRAKTDYLLTTEDIESAEALLVECGRYLDSSAYPDNHSPAAEEDDVI